MAGTLDDIDLSDPCAVLPVMRRALYRLAAGEQEVRVKYDDFDVALQPAALADLRMMVADLEQKCGRATGRRRRFAIRATY